MREKKEKSRDWPYDRGREIGGESLNTRSWKTNVNAGNLS